jgi:hypothetical protein
MTDISTGKTRRQEVVNGTPQVGRDLDISKWRTQYSL